MKTLFGVIRRRKLAESKLECTPVWESTRSQACQARSLGEPKFCDLVSAELLDNVDDEEDELESVNLFVGVSSQCLTRPEKMTAMKSILHRGCLRLWLIVTIFFLLDAVSCEIRSRYLEDSRLKPARHLPLEARRIGNV